MKRNVIFDAMRNIDPEFIEAAAPRIKVRASARFKVAAIAAAAALLLIGAAAALPFMMQESPEPPPVNDGTSPSQPDNTVEPIETLTRYFSLDGYPLSQKEIEVLELHRGGEIEIMENIESVEDYSAKKALYYGGGYEGFYQALVDCIYRTKLDIEIVRAEGFDDHRYDAYYKAVCKFLENNNPKYLIPSTWVRLPGGEKSISYNWGDDLFFLIGIDEARVAADDALLELWKQAALCRSLNFSDPSNDLEKYPLIEKMVILDAPSVKGQYFDAETCRTVIELEAAEYDAIAYGVGINLWRDSQNLTILAPGEKISFAPDFSGVVTIVYLDEIGLFGKKTVIEVKSSLDLIPAETVSFKSARLDSAVREYLGKSETDIILKTELVGINAIAFYGDVVSVNGEGVTVEQINAEVRAQVNDFSYDDLDNFPCLRNLTVYRNDLEAPGGNAIRYIPYIRLNDCGITDISGFRDSYTEILSLLNNGIEDAQVLESANKLWYIDLGGNPLERLVLPAKSFGQIRVDGTHLTSLDFLEPVLDIGQLSFDNTEITDLSILEGHRETER